MYAPSPPPYRGGDPALSLGTTFYTPTPTPQGDLHLVALLIHTYWPGLGQDPGAHPSGGELGEAWRRLLGHHRLAPCPHLGASMAWLVLRR